LWGCFCSKTQRELQENRNERTDANGHEVFEVRNRYRILCVLRSAELSGPYLLSMPGRGISRSTEIQADYFAYHAAVT
jgi:hypothetical protein